MISRKFVALLLIPASLLLSGFEVRKEKVPVAAQPGDERSAQSKLPQSHAPFWVQIANCKISYNNNTQLFEISLTPDVKALDGKPVQTTGFVLPLDASDKTKHFLLTKRTPVCLFCPPGSGNEVIEVRTEKPVEWTNQMVTVNGTLELINDGEMGIFFSLSGASAKP